MTGLTGAHKTTALTLPVLLEAARAGVTAIAFDLKYGERDSLAGAAQEWWRRGRSVLAFAPLDAASLRWNPLASCRSFGDAHEFATHLFPDDTAADADAAYWTGAERAACAALAWALATDGGGRSVARLRALAEAGPEAVSKYVRRHPRHPALAAHLGAYSAMLPKDQAGILQGIAARLEALADERVARATSDAAAEWPWDEIELRRLRREPTLLLIGVPQAELPRLRTLAQVLMRVVAAHMLRPRAHDETVPVVYVLEELPAWGPLPGLADHLATFRSRDVAIVATLQSEAQGQAVYGTAGWAAVAANFVTKLYFPSLADPDAERLSRALGVTALERVSRSRGWTARGRHDGEQRRIVEVPLRRPEALQGIGALPDQVVLRCPGLSPVLLWCPPFHDRGADAARLPDAPPSMVEIALRRRRAVARLHPRQPRNGHQPIPSAEAASEPAPVPVVESPAEDAIPAPRLSASARAADTRAQPVQADRGDAIALRTFVRAVLERCGEQAGDEGPSGNSIGARVVCRNGRLVEVRLESVAAFRLLGSGEPAQAVVRAWAARRWVKHVRPVFVLERRALETLDEDLRRALLARASSAP